MRVVFTEQLSESDHQYLRVFFRPKGSLIDVKADMELTDKKGKPLISAGATEPVFNQMIESFRSFDANGNTAQQGIPGDAATTGPCL